MEQKYEKITADLTAEIRLGILCPGDPIPTIKQLKERYGVGYYTVRKAHLSLKRRMLIEPNDHRRLAISSLAPYMA